MADIDKKILIDIISKKDTAAIDATIAELETLQKKINLLRESPIQAAGVSEFKTNIEAAAKKVSDFGTSSVQAFNNTEAAADKAAAATKRLEERLGSNLILTKSTTRSSADGELTTLSHKHEDNPFISEQTSFDQTGGVLSTKVTQNFAAEQAARDKSAAADEKAFSAKIAAAEKSRAEFIKGIQAEQAAQEKAAADAIAAEQKAVGQRILERQKYTASVFKAIQEEKAAKEKADSEVIAAEQKTVGQRILANQKYREALFSEQQKEKSDRDAAAATEKAEATRRANALNTFNNHPGKLQADEKTVDATTGTLQTVKVKTDELSGSTIKLNEETRKLSVSNRDLSDSFGQSSNSIFNAAGKVLAWTLATGAVFGAIHGIEGAIKSFSEIEAATVSLERIGRGFASSNDFGEASKQIAEGSRNVAAEVLKATVALGGTADEALTAANTFARLGLSQQETINATRTALVASNVAHISATDAANLLTSAFISFKGNVSDIPTILDQLNRLENTTRVSTNDLLQSVSRAGAVFREAGGTFQELAAITAVVSQATSRSGAEIGNALKFISTRLGDATVQQKVFAQTGIVIRNAYGELKPIGDLLGELTTKMQGLNNAEQAELGTAIAGSRQRNILTSILDNYADIQAKVIDQLENSDSALSENEKVLGTLEAKFRQLQAALVEFGNSIVGSGIGQALKAVLDIVTKVIGTLTSLGAFGVLITGVFATLSASVLLAATGYGTLSGALAKTQTAFAGTIDTAVANVQASNASAAAATTESEANLLLSQNLEVRAAAAARAAAAEEGLAAASTVAAASTAKQAGATGAAIAGEAALSATATAAPAAATTIGAAIAGGIATAMAAGAAIAIGGLIAYGLYQGYQSLFGKNKGINIDDPNSKEAKILDIHKQDIDKAAREVEASEKKKGALESELRIVAELNAKEAARGGLTENEIARREKLLQTIKQQSGATDPSSKADVEASLASQLDERQQKELSALAEKKLYLEEILKKKLQESEISSKIKFSNEELKNPLAAAERVQSIDPFDKKDAGAIQFKKELEGIVNQLHGIQQTEVEVEMKFHKDDKFDNFIIDVKTIKTELEGIQAASDESFGIFFDSAGDKAEASAIKVEQLKAQLDAIQNNDKFAIVREHGEAEDKKAITDAEDDLKKKIRKATVESKAEKLKLAFEVESVELKNADKLNKDLSKIVGEHTGKHIFKESSGALAEFDENNAQIQKNKQRSSALNNEIDELTEKRNKGTNTEDDDALVIVKLSERKALLKEIHSEEERIGQLRNQYIVKAVEDEYKRLDAIKKQKDEATKGLLGLSDEELTRSRIISNKFASGEAKAPSFEELANLDQQGRKDVLNAAKFFPDLDITRNVNVPFNENVREKSAGSDNVDVNTLLDKIIGGLDGRRGDQEQRAPQGIDLTTPQGQRTLDLNLQGFDEQAGRITGALGTLTETMNGLINVIGQSQKEAFIGNKRPRENSR